MTRDTRPWPQTITWPGGALAAMDIDGCLRLSVDHLPLLVFNHLLSALDLACDDCVDGGPTTMSGYTEWTSADPALASLGWDWHLETGTTLTLRQIGIPRSNLALCGPEGEHLSQSICSVLLTQHIAQLAWQSAVLQCLSTRYGA